MKVSLLAVSLVVLYMERHKAFSAVKPEEHRITRWAETLRDSLGMSPR